MALPVQSVRALPEHRDMLQAVAELLRESQAENLRRLLRDTRSRPVGPFKSEAAALAFLRDRLVSELRPRMVWLFGSRARGDPRPDSDFDLLVVLPDGLPERACDHAAVAAPLAACGLAFDVVPCHWSSFVAERAAGTGPAARAMGERRLLYADQELRRGVEAA
jgi:predicted nucleotidyltransferase